MIRIVGFKFKIRLMIKHKANLKKMIKYFILYPHFLPLSIYPHFLKRYF